MRTLLLAMLIACDTEDEDTATEAVENPTGECDKGDGSRACYHSPEATDTYIPICDGSVAREMWRIFVQSSGDAYMIPRPDGAGIDAGICDGADAELAAAFERSGLCEEVADPAVVNAMALEDAIVVSVALHQRLTFTAVDDGDGIGWISPWPPDDDMAAVCNTYADEFKDLAGICDIFQPAESGECLDEGYVLSYDEASRFAEKLNLLYSTEGR